MKNVIYLKPWKYGTAHGSINFKGIDKGWIAGYYKSSEGIVEISGSLSSGRTDKFNGKKYWEYYFVFIHCGYYHQMNIETTNDYTKLGLLRFAGKFQKKILAESIQTVLEFTAGADIPKGILIKVNATGAVETFEKLKTIEHGFEAIESMENEIKELDLEKVNHGDLEILQSFQIDELNKSVMDIVRYKKKLQYLKLKTKNIRKALNLMAKSSILLKNAEELTDFQYPDNQ